MMPLSWRHAGACQRIFRIISDDHVLFAFKFTYIAYYIHSLKYNSSGIHVQVKVKVAMVDDIIHVCIYFVCKYL